MAQVKSLTRDIMLSIALYLCIKYDFYTIGQTKTLQTGNDPSFIAFYIFRARKQAVFLFTYLNETVNQKIICILYFYDI